MSQHTDFDMIDRKTLWTLLDNENEASFVAFSFIG